MLVKTPAIILNSRKFGDSSKIISAFTRDFGRLSFIAKGSRNPKSKFGSAIEPLSFVEVGFYKKAANDLHLLANADIIKPFTKLTSSLEHLSVALLIAESIAYSHQENHQNEDLFDYFAVVLGLLNNLPQNEFNLFVASQFKLAETLGFWLQFDFMIEHDSDSIQKLYFSIEDGSPAIASSAKVKSFVFSFKNAFFLQNIFNLKTNNVCDVKIDDDGRREIIRFFTEYFSFHLEKKFVYKSFSLFT